VERLIQMLKRRDDKADFLRDLIRLLLEDYELYSEDVLFRDAVEEIYSGLRHLVIVEGRHELLDAYELAVLLRASLSGGIPDRKALLRGILEKLG